MSASRWCAAFVARAEQLRVGNHAATSVPQAQARSLLCSKAILADIDLRKSLVPVQLGQLLGALYILHQADPALQNGLECLDHFVGTLDAIALPIGGRNGGGILADERMGSFDEVLSGLM